MAEDRSYAQRLLHRWFVEYNPLYLVSAMFVLAGTILSSRGLASEGSLYGPLGVAAIAEVYAVALVLGAALLARLEQRRSAVMLALLTVVYQCDLTLHTETCPNLGAVGIVASAVWLVAFGGKLVGLMRAMRLTLNREAWITAGLGGAGLAVLPYVLPRLEPRGASAVVVLWAFGLVALHRLARVTREGLEAWPAIVLRRSVRASWGVWALLGALHVAFWATQYKLDGATLALALPLLGALRVEREGYLWPIVAWTLGIVAVERPGAFSLDAFLAAGVFALRASRATIATVVQTVVAEPYRAGETLVSNVVTTVDRAAMRRLYGGAAFALYLALWTRGWRGGSWPAHQLWLDVAFAAFLLFAATRLRVRIAFLPVALGVVRAVVAAHVVPTPHTMLGWGALTIGTGFLLLAISIAVAYRLRSAAAASSGSVKEKDYR